MRTAYSERIEQVVQAVIAILVIGGGLAIAVVELLRGADINKLPGWLLILVGLVGGLYFGARNVKQGISAGTNGVLDAARKVAVDPTILATLNAPADGSQSKEQS